VSCMMDRATHREDLSLGWTLASKASRNLT
jgi:hypothetical protein